VRNATGEKQSGQRLSREFQLDALGRRAASVGSDETCDAEFRDAAVRLHLQVLVLGVKQRGIERQRAIEQLRLEAQFPGLGGFRVDGLLVDEVGGEFHLVA
jgi:hypothetical protein